MSKRKSPLPVMPALEYVDGVAIFPGGTHGYKKVKINTKTGKFQGINSKLGVSTGRFSTAKEAAIALAKKEGKKRAMLELGFKPSIGARPQFATPRLPPAPDRPPRLQMLPR